MRTLNIVTKISIYEYEELFSEEKNIIDRAKMATSSAYAPYSEFHVGAAVLLESGEIIVGNNQENMAFPSGICAERTALFYAQANYPEQKIEMLAIAAFSAGKFTEDPISPCGACRQVLLEIENRQRHPVRILLYGRKETYIVDSVRDLLPLSFEMKNEKDGE